MDGTRLFCLFLPSYQINKNIFSYQASSVSGQDLETEKYSIINFINEVSFYTGSEIYYSYSNSPIEGLTEGLYYVEVINDKKQIRLFTSRSFVGSNNYIQFGPLSSGTHKFTLSEDDLKSIKQAASVMNLPYVSFIGDKSGVKVVAQDITNDTLGNFTVQISDKCNSAFEHHLALDNLRVLPGTYDVSVSPTITHFSNKSAELEYWIVMESV